ncbi:MAG: hypothetical protein ACQEQX_02355 [Thermodesulfobacteriota bacterium]
MAPSLCMLLFLGLFLLLSGCGPKVWTEPELDQDPAVIWQELQARETQKLEQHQGYLLRSSLHYQSARNSSRLVFSLWGNFDLPLRLDLKAGIGTTLSHWRLGQDMSMAYYPRQDKVFVYQDPGQALQHLELELPFTVPEIGEILTGRWAGLLPAEYARARAVQGQGWEFEFPESSRLQSIIVDPELRIVQASGESPLAWELEMGSFQDDQDAGNYASSLELDMGQEGQALFRIRELQLRKEDWPDSRLELDPPQDVQYVPLAL